jgi:UDPglucose 6-dehydrogenase
MRVAVIGAGHVGLVTAACLAEIGHEVTCADVDQDRVDAVNAGVSFIYEPGLDELVRRHAGERLRGTTDIAAAVGAAELSLIAVPVPIQETEDEALRVLRSVAQEIGVALRNRADYHTVVVKSTVLPGTTVGVVKPMVEDASGGVPGGDFGVAMNPEFLTEGQAVEDFLKPDRIVLGTEEAPTLAALEALYEPLGGARVRTSPTTAETIKLASNALLATLISFANEFADLPVAVGDVDVADVSLGLQLSRYLTVDGEGAPAVTAPLASYLEAGCGFGGSCLPKDLAALIGFARAVGAPMQVLEAAEAVNRRRPEDLVDLVRSRLDLDGARVSVLGLAFKPDTDDVRASPAFAVVAGLVASGADVRIYDPVAAEAFLDACTPPRPQAVATLADALDADALVIVTRWPEFEQIPQLLHDRANAPLVVDGRRMLDPRSVPRYAGIGLGRGHAPVGHD